MTIVTGQFCPEDDQPVRRVDTLNLVQCVLCHRCYLIPSEPLKGRETR